jgi:hypothetical protein
MVLQIFQIPYLKSFLLCYQTLVSSPLSSFIFLSLLLNPYTRKIQKIKVKIYIYIYIKNLNNEISNNIALKKNSAKKKEKGGYGTFI